MKNNIFLNLILILFTYINCSFRTTLFTRMCKEKKGENLIISPLSIFQVLSLTTNGAKGETQSEILEVLQAKDIEELNKINYDIYLLSKIFQQLILQMQL